MATNNAVNTPLSGTTGTGNFVGATSPTLITPLLGTPTSGNLANCTGYTISNISGLGANVGTWLATPSSANLAAAVTDETGSGVLVFGTAPTISTPNIVGVTNASAAAAGSVGQVVSSSVDSSSVSMSNGTPKTITEISLTAGDWNVWGAVQTAPAGGTTTSSFIGAISLTNNTLPGVTTLDVTQMLVFTQTAFTAGLGACISIPPSIINVSSTTTVYLVGAFNFATSTLNAGGAIIARRVR